MHQESRKEQQPQKQNGRMALLRSSVMSSKKWSRWRSSSSRDKRKVIHAQSIATAYVLLTTHCDKASAQPHFSLAYDCLSKPHEQKVARINLRSSIEPWPLKNCPGLQCSYWFWKMRSKLRESSAHFRG